MCLWRTNKNSVHYWGENPFGQWKLIITNEGRHRVLKPGMLKEWSLVFYGTDVAPVNFIPTPNLRNRHPGSFVRETSSLNDNPCSAVGKYLFLDQPDTCHDLCPDGYYGDNRRICQVCSSQCAKCYGPGQDHCSSCPAPKSLYKDSCVVSCPEGYYADQETEECLPCSSQCKTCENSADLCLTCDPGLYLHQQQCLGNCPRHTYPTEDLRCNTCDISCLSCSGPRDDDCLSCPTSTWYMNQTCRAQCPLAHYQERSSRRCLRCNRGCRDCQGPLHCNTCAPDWILNNGQCLQDTGCIKGHYSDGMKCSPCHVSCSECSGADEYSCTACPANRLLHMGRCVPSCPAGAFLPADGSRQCLWCGQGCSQCTSFTQCTQCQPHLLLHQKQCLTACPQMWFHGEGGQCQECHSSCGSCLGSSSSNCSSCSFGSYLFSGSCMKQCPDGHYAQPSTRNSECKACHHLCKTCKGPGQSACLSCHKNYALISGICTQCLLNEYFDDEKQSCQTCHLSCAQCSGPTDHDCQGCGSQLRLQPELKVCLPCCESNSLQPDNPSALPHCCPCTSDPELCGGFSDKIRSVASLGDPQHSIPFKGDEIVIPMNDVVPVVVGICTAAVLLFFILFGILQAVSSGFHRSSRLPSYKRVPLARYEGNSEKVALTHEDENDEEEDNLFEKT